MVRTRASFDVLFVPPEEVRAEIVAGESAELESVANESAASETAELERILGENAERVSVGAGNGTESVASGSVGAGGASGPRPSHSKPQGALRAYIGGPFDDEDGFGGPGGWWIFVAVDVQLSGEVVRPDLSGWRRPRLPEPDMRPIAMAPDWVCEVLSESSEAHDRVTKRRLYAAAGVAHYWLVDPNARTVEALTLEAGRWVDAGSFDEKASARVAPFEEVELPIGRLFLPRYHAE